MNPRLTSVNGPILFSAKRVMGKDIVRKCGKNNFIFKMYSLALSFRNRNCT